MLGKVSDAYNIIKGKIVNAAIAGPSGVSDDITVSGDTEDRNEVSGDEEGEPAVPAEAGE